MDYEKAYKDALNKAKSKIWNDKGHLLYEDDIIEIFPELAESEDERIRKEIIQFLQLPHPQFVGKRNHEKWIAWLEKQKTTEETLQYLKENHSPSEVSDFQAAMNIAVAKAYNKGYADGLEKQGEQKTTNSKEDDVRRRSTIQVLEYARSLDTYNQYGKADIVKNIAWLESQKTVGESLNISTTEECEKYHKAIDSCLDNNVVDNNTEPKFKVGDFVHCTTINGFEYTYIYKSNHGEVIHAFVIYSCGTHGVVSIDDMLFEPSIFTKRKATTEEIVTLLQSIHKNGFIWDAEKKELKKIEQRSNNNTEPKFQVGDWVIFNNHHESIYQVEKFENYQYFLRHYLGGTMSVYFDNELIRPWSIQDAKDGDVLISNESHVIFKEIDGLNIKCYCTYHYLGLNPSLYIDTLQNKDAFHPATKEQRDFLFQKIREAGYKWDAEKKELIKNM